METVIIFVTFCYDDCITSVYLSLFGKHTLIGLSISVAHVFMQVDCSHIHADTVQTDIILHASQVLCQTSLLKE